MNTRSLQRAGRLCEKNNTQSSSPLKRHTSQNHDWIRELKKKTETVFILFFNLKWPNKVSSTVSCANINFWFIAKTTLCQSSTDQSSIFFIYHNLICFLWYYQLRFWLDIVITISSFLYCGIFCLSTLKGAKGGKKSLTYFYSPQVKLRKTSA